MGSLYSQAILGTAGLVGYWRLGERQGSVAKDSFGSNDGTLTGSPTMGVSGVVNYDTDTAYNFDGVDDVIDFSSDATFRMNGTNFSVETWFSANVDFTIQQKIVGFTNGSQANNSPWFIRFQNSGVAFYVGDGVTNAEALKNSLTSRTWYHAVGTFDATNRLVNIFVDSVAIGAGLSTTVVEPMSATTFQIGGTVVNNVFANAKIDEVAIYNVLLSSTTVLEHYRLGAGLYRTTNRRKLFT